MTRNLSLQKEKRYRNFYYNSYYNRRNRYRTVRPKKFITPWRRAARNNFLLFKQWKKQKQLQQLVSHMLVATILKTKPTHYIKKSKQRLKKLKNTCPLKKKLVYKIFKNVIQQKRKDNVYWKATPFRLGRHRRRNRWRRRWPAWPHPKYRKWITRINNLLFLPFKMLRREQFVAFFKRVLLWEKAKTVEAEIYTMKKILWEELLERAAAGDIFSFQYGDESYYKAVPDKKLSSSLKKKPSFVENVDAVEKKEENTSIESSVILTPPSASEAATLTNTVITFTAPKSKVVDHGRYSGDVDDRYDNWAEIYAEEIAEDEEEECEYLKKKSSPNFFFAELYKQHLCSEKNQIESAFTKDSLFLNWLWKTVYPNKWYGLEGVENENEDDIFVFRYWKLSFEQLDEYTNYLDNLINMLEIDDELPDAPIALDRHPDWIDCENEETGMLHVFDVFPSMNPLSVLICSCTKLTTGKRANHLFFLFPTQKFFDMNVFITDQYVVPEKLRKRVFKGKKLQKFGKKTGWGVTRSRKKSR